MVPRWRAPARRKFRYSGPALPARRVPERRHDDHDDSDRRANPRQADPPRRDRAVRAGEPAHGTEIAAGSHGGPHPQRPQSLADHALSTLAGDGSGIALVGRPRARTGDEARFTVVRFHEGRRTAREFVYEPKPVESYELDKLEVYIDAYDRQLGRVAGWPRSQIEEAFREGLGIPEFALPVYDALLAPAGDVWLAVDDTPEGMVWVVLDDRLAESATVLIPAGEELLAVADGRLITVGHSEFDVPFLNLYEILAP